MYALATRFLDFTEQPKQSTYTTLSVEDSFPGIISANLSENSPSTQLKHLQNLSQDQKSCFHTRHNSTFEAQWEQDEMHTIKINPNNNTDVNSLQKTQHLEQLEKNQIHNDLYTDEDEHTFLQRQLAEALKLNGKVQFPAQTV